MKLYIFNNTGRASVYGVGTYIAELIESLKNSNIKITLVCLNTEEIKVKIQEDESNFSKLLIPCVYCYNITNKDRNYYFRNLVFLLKRYIPDEIDNIFHLNYMGEGQFAFWLKRLFKGKIFLTVHYTNWGLTLFGDINKLKNILSKERIETEFDCCIVESINNDKILFDNCDQIICIAKHSYDSIIEIYKINNNRLHLINNSIKDCFDSLSSSRRNILRNKYLIDKNTKVILFAGRLDEIKGVNVLIRAFKNVLKLHPNSHLFIVGNGDFQDLMSETIVIWSKVSFTGFLNKIILYELFQITDVGVVCSIYEEFGFIALEMMMHSLPIVVSDTGGLAEIVKDGYSGLTVPVTEFMGKKIVDESKLCEKINCLLDNNELSHELGNNARKEYLKKYSGYIFRDEIIKLYKGL